MKIEENRAKVFLVDDHEVVRHGLSQYIAASEGFTVCGTADTISTALQMINETLPDIVVADLSLKDQSGIDLIRALKQRHPSLPVLVLSMHDEVMYAERVVREGAGGYVMKSESMEVLIGAIKEVLAGRIYLSSAMKERLLDRLLVPQDAGETGSIELLSNREFEVFKLIGEGFKISEIARQLCLSVKTIETYREHIKEKLRISTSAELIRHAIQWKITNRE